MRILVVEDDASLRTVIRLVLEQEGYEIAEAANGRIALEQIDEQEPDLVLVDAKMPVLTGEELIDRLRADPRHASIPAVLLTGLPSAVREQTPADAVIAKPFEKSQLLRVINDLLGARQR